MIASIIDDSRCDVSDVAFRTAPPIGGLSRYTDHRDLTCRPRVSAQSPFVTDRQTHIVLMTTGRAFGLNIDRLSSMFCTIFRAVIRPNSFSSRVCSSVLKLSLKLGNNNNFTDCTN